MGVACAGQIFGCSAKFHGDTDFMDQIPSHWPDDMRAQYPIGGGIGEDLHKTISGEIGLGTAIAHEGKFANFIVATNLFQLFFGLADTGHFWMGVNHTGDHIVIHMARLFG